MKKKEIQRWLRSNEKLEVLALYHQLLKEEGIRTRYVFTDNQEPKSLSRFGFFFIETKKLEMHGLVGRSNKRIKGCVFDAMQELTQTLYGDYYDLFQKYENIEGLELKDMFLERINIYIIKRTIYMRKPAKYQGDAFYNYMKNSYEWMKSSGYLEHSLEPLLHAVKIYDYVDKVDLHQVTPTKIKSLRYLQEIFINYYSDNVQIGFCMNGHKLELFMNIEGEDSIDINFSNSATKQIMQNCYNDIMHDSQLKIAREYDQNFIQHGYTTNSSDLTMWINGPSYLLAKQLTQFALYSPNILYTNLYDIFGIVSVEKDCDITQIKRPLECDDLFFKELKYRQLISQSNQKLRYRKFNQNKINIQENVNKSNFNRLEIDVLQEFKLDHYKAINNINDFIGYTIQNTRVGMKLDLYPAIINHQLRFFVLTQGDQEYVELETLIDEDDCNEIVKNFNQIIVKPFNADLQQMLVSKNIAISLERENIDPLLERCYYDIFGLSSFKMSPDLDLIVVDLDSVLFRHASSWIRSNMNFNISTNKLKIESPFLNNSNAIVQENGQKNEELVVNESYAIQLLLCCYQYYRNFIKIDLINDVKNIEDRHALMRQFIAVAAFEPQDELHSIFIHEFQSWNNMKTVMDFAREKPELIICSWSSAKEQILSV